MTQEDSGGGDRQKQHEPQTLKADISLHGTISVPQPHQDRHSSEATERDHSSKRPYLHRFEVIGAILVGVGLVILGVLQYCVISRQTAIIGTQLAVTEAIERPFVFRKNVWLEYGLDDNRWRFTIEWENAGNSAPVKLVLKPYCNVGTIDMVPPFSGDYRATLKSIDEYPFLYVLGPKQAQKIGRCPLDLDKLADARKEQKFYFIGGQAIYGDAFGILHETRFCEQYPVPQITDSQPHTPIEVRQFLGDPLFCWGYNCTDAECRAHDAEEDRKRETRSP